jgi:hypothetical protein
MKTTSIVILVMLCLSDTGTAQVEAGGQAATQYYKSASLQTPRAANAGKPGFGWQTVFWGDVQVTENVNFSATATSTDISQITFEYLAIRIANITPLGLNLQVGRFDLPFCNLGERRYPRRNPFYGLPLIHEYRTALSDNVTTESDLLARRGAGMGMRVLDKGIYDLGFMASGSAGILDYAFALSTGTVSATTYSPGNTNSQFSTIFRLAVTPATGLTIGAAYACGAYLEEQSPGAVRVVNPGDFIQKSLEGDLEYSYGHLILNAEGVYTVYPVPFEFRDEQLKVLGYNIEGKYTLIPRLFVALRVGGLRFGDVQLGPAVQPWDYDVDEFEGSLGYFLDRDVLCKVVRRETRTHGGTRPKDSMTVAQIVVAF